MTVEEIRQHSYIPGIEGLMGPWRYFDLGVYTEMLVQEIVKWSEANGGLAPGPDEECLREHLDI